MTGVDVWAAVERLGGWGVVVWIVVWLTKRWEAKMDAISATIATQAVAITRLLEESRDQRRLSEDTLSQMIVQFGRISQCLDATTKRMLPP